MFPEDPLVFGRIKGLARTEQRAQRMTLRRLPKPQQRRLRRPEVVGASKESLFNEAYVPNETRGINI